MNRRKLLAGGAAALPLAVVGVSPVEAEANPIDRVLRLARELSQALADWNGALLGGGPWVARVYPAGSISHPISLEDSSATASPIAELFRQWQENGATSFDGMSDADGVAVCDEYRRLQVAIVAATPRTPRDLAMQFWCDSDGGCSTHSADFLDRMRALAGVVEAEA